MNLDGAASITATGAGTRIQSGTAQPPDSIDLAPLTRSIQQFFTNDRGFRTPIPNTDAAYPTLRATLGGSRARRPHGCTQSIERARLDQSRRSHPRRWRAKFIISHACIDPDAGARIETSTLWDGNAGAIVGRCRFAPCQRWCVNPQRVVEENVHRDGVIIGTGSAGDVLASRPRTAFQFLMPAAPYQRQHSAMATAE